MAYVLDIVIVLIFALMIWLGHRNGFIKTVAGLIAFVVALVLSTMLAAPVSEMVYDRLVEPPVLESLEAQLGEGSPAASQLDAAFEQMPAFVTDQLAAQGIVTGADALEYIGAAQEDETASESVVRQVIRPVVLPVLKVLCSLLLFFVIQLILSLLLKLLDVVAKLPLLKQLNKSLGVVAGVVQGALWVFLIATLLYAVAASGLVPVVSNDLLESTIVIRWVQQYNPLSKYMMDLFVVR